MQLSIVAMAPEEGFIYQTARDREFTHYPQAVDVTPYTEDGYSDHFLASCEETSSTLRTAKVIFIGDVAVGKTSLITRFCHNVFDLNYKATIGVDFEVEHFDILGVPFNLQIWDTAGQERFKCIASAYYRGTKAIVVVFDMGDPHSLHSCQTWMNEALKQQHPSATPLKFLVGTKSDLVDPNSEHYYAIQEAAREMANTLQAELWIASSKTGHNVRDLFFRMSALTLQHVVEAEMTPSKKVPVGLSLVQKEEKEKQRPGCCK